MQTYPADLHPCRRRKHPARRRARRRPANRRYGGPFPTPTSATRIGVHSELIEVHHTGVEVGGDHWPRYGRIRDEVIAPTRNSVDPPCPPDSNQLLTRFPQQGASPRLPAFSRTTAKRQRRRTTNSRGTAAISCSLSNPRKIPGAGESASSS